MTSYEWSMIIINVAGLAAIVISLRIYFGQLGVLKNGLEQGREQIKMVEKSSMATNLLVVAKFLQNEEFQRAKNILADQDDVLLGKEPSKWPLSFRSSARIICSCYDILGLMIKHEVVSEQPVLDNWGRSVVHFHNSLKRFIDQERTKIGPDYWNEFTWLADKATNNRWAGALKETN